MYLFADDTKILRAINNTSDHDKLQEDLNSLVNWSRNWLHVLTFHPDKCQVLSIGNQLEELQNYTMSTQSGLGDNIIVLDRVKEARDLGIIIDNKLSFDTHINTKAKKANSIMGLIRRSFSYLDEEMLL